MGPHAGESHRPCFFRTRNWLTDGWLDAHGTLDGTVIDWANLTGTAPGFADMADQDYRLLATSPCVDAGDDLPADVLPDHDLTLQYVRHQRVADRVRDGVLDLGSFAYQ